MKTDSKIAIGISSVFVALGIFCFAWILPFIFIWSSFGINLSNEESLPYLEKAVKFSVFNAQKRYTIETIIPTLLILEKNKEAIAYYEDYEKQKIAKNNIDSKVVKTLVTYAYIKEGNYEKALSIAKETNNLYQQAKIYIETNDLDNAKTTVEKIFSTKTQSKRPYLYVAQIQLKEGYAKSANTSIDKLLKENPAYLDALETKAEILKALGQTNEYNES
jgi:predicted Zn-dependent protease